MSVYQEIAVGQYIENIPIAVIATIHADSSGFVELPGHYILRVVCDQRVNEVVIIIKACNRIGLRVAIDDLA